MNYKITTYWLLDI